jgi:uncharacterized tellurite resistance protein B-like protein
MSSLSAEDRFNIEVIKLLLQVAWSDQALTQSERLAIFGMGRSWLVPEDELQKLMEQLRLGGELPAPDLEVLRSRRDEVIEAVRALVAADGKLAHRERALLARISVMLGLPG